MKWLRVRSSAWLVTLVGCVLPAAAQPSQKVHGLIVQLKDAPSHDAEPSQAERHRWHRLLSQTELDRGRDAPSPPVLRPNGRAAQLLRFSRALDTAEAEQLASRLRERPEVAWVAPNVRERALQATDPMFSSQWALHANGGSNAQPMPMRLRGVPGFASAWTRGYSGAGTAPVAVLDTGITSHPELAGRFLPGHDFVDDDADPTDPGDWSDGSSCEASDSSWHGTTVAGLVAALTNNGEGLAGINWNGAIVPVRVAERCGALLSDILDGLRWAAGITPGNPNPVRVINLSFGGSGDCTPYQPVIDELRARGVVLVAAAGNQHGVPTRPAKCPGVIGVAALNRDGFKTHYSNFGPQITIATVGGDDPEGRWTSLADGGVLALSNAGQRNAAAPSYAYAFGTSFSAPIVAGTVSLMLSVNATLSAEQIIAGLRASARPHVVSPTIGQCSSDNPGRCICTTSTCGAGILDAEQAVMYALDPAAYVAPVRQPEVIDNAEVTAAAALGADKPSNSTVSVAAAPSAETPQDAGGGAASPHWLLGLALAAWLARRQSGTQAATTSGRRP